MPTKAQARPQALIQMQGCVVIDTNVVLDLLVFDDAASQTLCHALGGGSLRWLATAPMREELARVLAYPAIARRLDAMGRSATAVLQTFDVQVHATAVAAKAPVTCKDPDDQKFIDLAVAHQALLLSKDKAVLCMARRVGPLGARITNAWA